MPTENSHIVTQFPHVFCRWTELRTSKFLQHKKRMDLSQAKSVPDLILSITDFKKSAAKLQRHQIVNHFKVLSRSVGYFEGGGEFLGV
jgi:hypothetical protein